MDEAEVIVLLVEVIVLPFLEGKTRKEPVKNDSGIDAVTYLCGDGRSSGKGRKCRER